MLLQRRGPLFGAHVRCYFRRGGARVRACLPLFRRRRCRRRDPLNPDPSLTNSFTGTDNNNAIVEQGFRYDVMLLHNGEPVPQDPEIVNDPGGGHFKLFHDIS